MATWQDRANRVLALFEGSTDDAEDRTWTIMNHVLDEGHRDDYISKDFYNVQQTAGGLPDGVSFANYVSMVSGHVRTNLLSDGFDENLGDDSIKAEALSIDENIRRHIRFLNGSVHQAAAGQVHLDLWNLILAARNDDSSIYSCYRNYLVDA